MANVISRRLPPDPDGMNHERARWVAETLEVFERHGERPSVDATEDERRMLATQNLSDFLADLGHYCDRAGMDLQYLLHNAALQYEEETEGEGAQLAKYRRLEAVWQMSPVKSTAIDRSI